MLPPTFIEGFHDPEILKNMKYNTLGNTGLQVSIISLGGGPLGGLYFEAEEQEKIKLVQDAIKCGINYIDTAPWYGNGRSEEVLGKALKDIPRKAYYIGTKVGRYEQQIDLMFDFTAKRVQHSVNKSLQLLGLDYVDVIQVHDLEFAQNTELILNETLPALKKIVDQGKARFIGITGYPVSLLKEVIEKSQVKIDLVLSYARNTLIDNSLQDYMEFFESRGIGVICACAVSMGLLCEGALVDWHPAPQYIKDACKEAAKYCKKEGVDLSRLAVQHSLRLKGVHTHLMGNDNTGILHKNLESVLTKPSHKEEEVAREVIKRFFEPLPQKHWEGQYLVEYWTKLREIQNFE